MKLNYQIKYNTTGVILLKNFFPKKEIDFLEKKINSYIKKNKKKLKGKDINLINGKVNSLHNFKDIFFKKFSKQKKILNIVKNLLKDNPKFRKCEYFAKPRKIGLESPLHQDNFYWNLKNGKGLTIWIPLDEVNKKNGSLMYLLKSHNLGNVKHEASFAPGSSQKVSDIKEFKKKYKLKIFNLTSGDCLIHHSQVIHGSSKNSTLSNRRAFTIQFMGKKEKINKIGLKNYQKSLRMQISKRKIKSIK
tara:strand:+ start:1155 stop:1895 length:741 start_codon:yes stop_codon:yes gene_type:complete